MKTWAILFFAVAITIGISSCHCAGDCTSHRYQFSIILMGYTDSDVVPGILKSYVKGSNFTNFRDSTVYVSLANGNMLANGLSQHSIQNIQGNDSTDYMLILPKAGLTYLVTNMAFPLEDCTSCARKFYIPTLTNYTLNGVPVNNSSHTEVWIYK